MIDLDIIQHLCKYIGVEILIISDLKNSGFLKIKSIEIEKEGASLKFENSNIVIFKKWNELQGFKPVEKNKKNTELVKISDSELLSINDILLYTNPNRSKIEKRVVSFTNKYATLDDGMRVKREGKITSKYYKIERIRKVEKT